MPNDLQIAFNEIAELRSLPQEVVLEALQMALVSAYRRDANASAAQAIEARIDPATGRARIFVEKEVTDDVRIPATEVSLEKARFYNPEAQIGDTVMVQVEGTTKKFGRIAAQTAKQVILQKIREAERNSLFEEYVTREGEIITGTVQSMNSAVVTLSLGRAEAILPRAQQIPGERYRQHEKVRVYVMEVKRTNKGPQIVCSRSHRNMLRRLLEIEVPEIYNGQIEIRSIAREAGYRSKVAVAALQEGIDPVGACVGMRGMRIQNIVKELHDERIDVIEWGNDPKDFITKALSPARVTGVYLEDDIHTGRTAIVIVPDDQLSLAIGREGQNARLAAKLTGWRIDIKSVSETVQSALDNLDLPPLSDLVETHPVLIVDVQRIMDKKNASLTVMPEEYTTLNKFADLIERKLHSQREQERLSWHEQLAAVKATLPAELFEVPLTALPLSEDILQALQPMGNVGAVMLATLVDEDSLHRLVAKLPDNPMLQIQSALDVLMESGIDFAELIEPTEAQAEPLPVVETLPVTPVIAQAEDDEEELVLDAFGGVVKPEPVVVAPVVTEERVLTDDTWVDAIPVEEDEDDDEGGKRDKKKGRQKRRQLIFDEESGEVVSKRKHKTNRKRGRGWDDDF
jgi:N utilization substance protein A